MSVVTYNLPAGTTPVTNPLLKAPTSSIARGWMLLIALTCAMFATIAAAQNETLDEKRIGLCVVETIVDLLTDAKTVMLICGAGPAVTVICEEDGSRNAIFSTGGRLVGAVLVEWRFLYPDGIKAERRTRVMYSLVGSHAVPAAADAADVVDHVLAGLERADRLVMRMANENGSGAEGGVLDLEGSTEAVAEFKRRVCELSGDGPCDMALDTQPGAAKSAVARQ